VEGSKVLVLMSVLVLAAGGQAASDTATPAPVVAEQPPADTGLKPGERRVKLVCKTQAPTGTRFAKQRCIEISAKERQQEEDRAAFEAVQGRPNISTARSN
jgi:hypothetical protein